MKTQREIIGSTIDASGRQKVFITNEDNIDREFYDDEDAEEDRLNNADSDGNILVDMPSPIRRASAIINRLNSTTLTTSSQVRRRIQSAHNLKYPIVSLTDVPEWNMNMRTKYNFPMMVDSSDGRRRGLERCLTVQLPRNILSPLETLFNVMNNESVGADAEVLSKDLKAKNRSITDNGCDVDTTSSKIGAVHEDHSGNDAGMSRENDLYDSSFQSVTARICDNEGIREVLVDEDEKGEYGTRVKPLPSRAMSTATYCEEEKKECGECTNNSCKVENICSDLEVGHYNGTSGSVDRNGDADKAGGDFMNARLLSMSNMDISNRISWTNSVYADIVSEGMNLQDFEDTLKDNNNKRLSSKYIEVCSEESSSQLQSNNIRSKAMTKHQRSFWNYINICNCICTDNDDL